MIGGDAEGRHPAAASWIGLLLAAVAALSLALLAWALWQREHARPAWAVETGAAVSVLLVNGQVYYGEVAEISSGYLRLYNVYYVQAIAAPGASAPSNQLVNRGKADWHGPQWMAISTDKIVLVEGIGPKSRLAELIAQEKKLGPAQ